MLNRKMKKILAVALCGIMTVVAIPMLSAKAENSDTTTHTDCAECTEYKMTADAAYPEANKSGWETARVLTDTDTGLLVKNTNNNSAYVTRTTTPVSMDGAHMKLTFDSTTTNKFYVTINNNKSSYNNHSLGIRFTIGLYSGGSIVCHVDGTEIGSVSNVSEIGIGSGAVEIKTSITDSGDFVFNVNGYDYVISSANWANSTNLSRDSVYFAIAPSGNYAITYTWNYFHGREDICYSEVVAVDALIENMTTNAEIIAARKAYLALSDAEKAVVENAEILKNTAGTLSDSAFYLMTSSVAYPEADKSGWETARVLTDTENGLLVKNTNNNSAYVTRTSTPVSMDGAHMKLTFDSTTTNKFYVTINNNKSSYNNHSLGIRFTIGLYSGGTIVCHVDGTQIGSVSNVSEIGIGSGAVEIKTSITDSGDFVFNINGYDYVISSENWANSTNLSEDSAYFAIAPSGNYAITYTWNYFHSGADVCYEGLADAENKIELCHPTTPIKANVDVARNAYNALSEEHKAIVINYDKLTSAEANVKATDFYHYGLTEAQFLTDSSGTGWDSKISRTQVSNGWNINFHGANNQVYKVREDRAIVLDGAHVGLSVEHGTAQDNFYMTLSNSKTKDGDNFLYVRLDTRVKDTRGGELFLYVGAPSSSTVISTVNLPDKSTAGNDRVSFPLDESNEMDVRFDVDNSGNVYVTVNGSYVKVTKDQLTTIGFDATETVYIGVAPVTGYTPNVTLHYSVSGGTDSYDEVTGDTNGDNKANVLDLARMKNNEEKDIKDILYYRKSSDLDEDGNSCDAEDLNLLRKELVK